MAIAIYLSFLEPPKPIPRQSAVPTDGLFESQDKADPFSASSVSSKITQQNNQETNKTNYKQQQK